MVTKAAGLAGSHPTEALLERGDEVVGIDTFLTGRPENLEPVHRHPRFCFIEADGEPLVHPKPVSCRGNVNPIEPRACYDESKRFAEAAVTTYARSFGLDVALVRIFNTYGPRVRLDDGRVVTNFAVQALCGDPLIVRGDSTQTRSFCDVDDQVQGLLALMDSGESGPLNIDSLRS